MQNTIDQYQGCLLGLALGDALGAPYEGGPFERFVWRIIGKTSHGFPRWTDDTQMSIDVAEILLKYKTIDQIELANKFAQSCQWSRGYGPGAVKVLNAIKAGVDWKSASTRQFKDGSYGNGAAMRASPVALFFHKDINRLLDETRKAAEITHAHPLAIDGAIAISIAISSALNGNFDDNFWIDLNEYCSAPIFRGKFGLIKAWLHNGELVNHQTIVKKLGNGISAQESVATAIYIAMRFINCSFEELIKFVISLKGDVDTIGAMAGAIWGAYNGVINLPNIHIETKDYILQLASLIHEQKL